MEKDKVKSGISAQDQYTDAGKPSYILPLLAALAAIAVYLAINGMDDFTLAVDRALIGSSGCLMAFLFFVSWKAYRNERIPMPVSVLAGIGAMLSSYITCYGNVDIIFETVVLLLMIFPVIIIPIADFFLHKLIGSRRLVCAVDILIAALLCAGLCIAAEADLREDYMIPAIWLSEGVLWSLAVNVKGGGTKRRDAQWKAWLVTLVILYLYICAGDELRWEQVQRDLLSQVLAAFVPFFYPLLFRKISDRISGGRRCVLKIGIAYFIAALILIWSFSGGLYIFMSDRYCSPDMAFYGLLMADIVFEAEFKEYRKKNTAAADRKAAFLAGVAAVISNIAGAVLVFFGNERVRTIFYDIGFESVNIAERDRADWLGYRMTAVKCFFAGNMDLLEEMYGAHGREGYQSLSYSAGFEAVIYRQGCLWLIVLMLPVLAAAVYLFRWRSGKPFLNRCAKYLAAGYLIRAAAVIFSQMLLFTSYEIQLPFTGYAMADIIVLAILLWEWHNQAETDDETFGGTEENRV